jgi:hypothetical protein
MGTAAGPVLLTEIRRLNRKKKATAARRLTKLRAALTDTDYSGLNQQLQDTYGKLTKFFSGQQQSSNVSVTKRLEEIRDLEKAFVSFLETHYSLAHFQGPQNVNLAHEVLIFLDVIHNILLAKVLQRATPPSPDPSEVAQMLNGHHFACLGYSDVILQAVCKLTGTQVPRPMNSTDDFACFTDYVACINKSLP